MKQQKQRRIPVIDVDLTSEDASTSLTPKPSLGLARHKSIKARASAQISDFLHRHSRRMSQSQSLPPVADLKSIMKKDAHSSQGLIHKNHSSTDHESGGGKD